MKPYQKKYNGLSDLLEATSYSKTIPFRVLEAISVNDVKIVLTKDIEKLKNFMKWVGEQSDMEWNEAQLLKMLLKHGKKQFEALDWSFCLGALIEKEVLPTLEVLEKTNKRQIWEEVFHGSPVNWAWNERFEVEGIKRVSKRYGH